MGPVFGVYLKPKEEYMKIVTKDKLITLAELVRLSVRARLVRDSPLDEKVARIQWAWIRPHDERGRRVKIAGNATPNRVGLNWSFFRNPDYLEEFEETVRHELAHVMQFHVEKIYTIGGKPHHGAVWWRLYKLVGGKHKKHYHNLTLMPETPREEALRKRAKLRWQLNRLDTISEEEEIYGC